MYNEKTSDFMSNRSTYIIMHIINSDFNEFALDSVSSPPGRHEEYW